MSVRCFVAVELEADIQDGLARLQGRLRKKLRDNESSIKWVQPERIHLTLKFLGEVADNVIPDICDAVSIAADEFSEFSFTVGNCGCFPPGRPARVMWVGVTEGYDDLQALAEAVDGMVGELGFASEQRRFSAHLTLARVRDANAGQAVLNAVGDCEPFVLGVQKVSAVTVFQSELTRTGPIYTALHHAPLSGSG